MLDLSMYSIVKCQTGGKYSPLINDQKAEGLFESLLYVIAWNNEVKFSRIIGGMLEGKCWNPGCLRM